MPLPPAPWRIPNEYRVRAIGNDAEAEGYLNNMAQEGWTLKFAFSVGDTGRAQYVHRRAIASERPPKFIEEHSGEASRV